MTPLNMARHRNNPNMPFWRMLKEGSDHFEITRREPKVDICEKRYVFDVEGNGRFDARGRCPALHVPNEIASAVSEKQQRDEQEIAALVSRGTPTVAVKTGADGGMNEVFLAKVRSQDRFDNNGRIFSLASTQHVPAMGNNVNPPRIADSDTATATVAAPAASAPATGTRVASADAGSTPNPLGGVGSAVSKWLGFGSDTESNPQPAAAPKPRPAVAKTSAPANHRTAAASRPAQSAPSRTPAAEERQTAAAAPPPAAPAAAAPAYAPALIAGAAPVVSSNSFEGRWGGMR
jgi:hypothetical protein